MGELSLSKSVDVVESLFLDLVECHPITQIIYKDKLANLGIDLAQVAVSELTSLPIPVAMAIFVYFVYVDFVV
jgi:hypothetical protein